LTGSQLEALTRLQAGRSIEELKFLPFLGRGKDLTTVLDGSSGEVLGLLELDPWPSLQQIWQQKKEAREAQQAQATESVDSTDSGDDPEEPSSAEPDADEVPAGELKDS
jgi:hypothetical protein